MSGNQTQLPNPPFIKTLHFGITAAVLGLCCLYPVKAVRGTEVIKMSALEMKKKEFSVERDIFSPIKRDATTQKQPQQRTFTPPPPVTDNKPKRVVRERDVAAEIREQLAYEGYVMRNTKNLALVTINGEFFVVAPGDVVADKINIVNVQKKILTVKVAAEQFEIILKGDDEQK